MTDTKRTDGRTAAPIGANINEALAGANTPMAALAAAYNHAPHPMIRKRLDHAAMRVLTSDLGLIQELLFRGPACSRDAISGEGRNMVSIFASSMKAIEGQPIAPTATVYQIGEELAEVVDRGINRILFDDDDLISREALSNVIEGHAQLVAGLSDLALPEDVKQKARAKQQEEASDE